MKRVRVEERVARLERRGRKRGEKEEEMKMAIREQKGEIARNGDINKKKRENKKLGKRRT